MTLRTRPAFGLVQGRRLFSCAVAEQLACREAHPWSARLGDDRPGVLAGFVLEKGDEAHLDELGMEDEVSLAVGSMYGYRCWASVLVNGLD